MSAAGVAHVRGSASQAARYADEDGGPTPAEQMGGALIAHRAARLPFKQAWTLALGALALPDSGPEAQGWRVAFASTRFAWELG